MYQGVTSAFYVWVDGRLAGFSKSSRCPAEFNITPMLSTTPSDGNHVVDVQVYDMAPQVCVFTAELYSADSHTRLAGCGGVMAATWRIRTTGGWPAFIAMCIS